MHAGWCALFCRCLGLRRIDAGWCAPFSMFEGPQRSTPAREKHIYTLTNLEGCTPARVGSTRLRQVRWLPPLHPTVRLTPTLAEALRGVTSHIRHELRVGAVVYVYKRPPVPPLTKCVCPLVCMCTIAYPYPSSATSAKVHSRSGTQMERARSINTPDTKDAIPHKDALLWRRSG